MAKGKSEFDTFETNVGGGGDEGGDEDSAGMEYEDGEGMEVDLSGTSETVAYPTFPKGIYDAELIELEYTRSQRSNNPMWVTIWELTDEKLADDKGRQPRQWLHLTFNEGGLPRVKRALARMVCDGDANKTLLQGKFSPQKVADEGTLIGARARLKLTIRRYEGQNRNSVQEVLPPSQGSGSSGGFANL